MRIHALGDAACLASFEDPLSPETVARVRVLAERLRAAAPAGVTDIVSAYGDIAVLYDPERVPAARGELPWRVIHEWLEREATGLGRGRARAGREVEIPVVYGGEHGPDLDLVARHCRMTPEEVVRRHSAASYTVAAIGFLPGFPYLLGLPDELATPRRATPRLRVPAGAVGIGAAQTGVYPRESPGGWNIIGRTGLELFVPGRATGPALLAAGDRVRFRPSDRLPVTPTTEGAPGTVAAGGAAIEIVRPGGLLTVQDLGRPGHAALGVARGGALDPWAAMAANLAVGNAPEAPLFEATYVGPILRFAAPAVIAAVGAETSALPSGRPIAVKAGDTLDCSTLALGARLYLAVAGGLRAPLVLGGRGTHLGGRFGGPDGRALIAGDRVGVGPSDAGVAPVPGRWRLAAPVPPAARKTAVELRLVPGPDWARLFRRHSPAGAIRAVEARRFTLSAKSDRMGARLAGEAFTVPGGGDDVSRPVVPGTVQLPPDGQPIVLLGESQTIGGYAQLGHVATADLARLAQCRPGAEVYFRVVDVAVAQQARLVLAADLARLRAGLGLLVGR